MPTLKIPIGVDDFRKLRENHLYYVDKTHMIKEFWENSAEVLLLPRPRRFGKTLNLSMLRWFFERNTEDTSTLFEGLHITENPVLMAEQGQYPVIHLDFKSIKFLEWKEALFGLRGLIFRVCESFKSVIPQEQWPTFEAIQQADSPMDVVQSSLLKLCQVLHQVTGQSVIVLIDEYDAPLLEAWSQGYYEEMTTFLRGLLGSLLKGNLYLKKALLTGILRVARESIFSDLNNLEVYSLMAPQFSTCFGFTPQEVERVLREAAMDPLKKKQLQEWYNGYLFGKEVIYNPWSLLEYVKHQPSYPQPYWANTSANAVVRQLILDESTADIQHDVEALLNGQPLQRLPLNEHIALRDMRGQRQDIWNFLTFSGYLKPIAEHWNESKLVMEYDLTIPNLEVRAFYQHTVEAWLNQQLSPSGLHELLNALMQADWSLFRKILRNIIRDSLSYHDTSGKTPEKVYHAFVLGMLLNLPHYRVQSNRESGYGRYDVMVIPQKPQKPGFVFEFKKIDEGDDEIAETALEAALKQLQEKAYAAQLRAEGITDVTGIGIVIEGKQIWLETVTL